MACERSHADRKPAGTIGKQRFTALSIYCDNRLASGRNSAAPPGSGGACEPSVFWKPLSRVADRISQTNYRIRLSAFLTLNDVKLDVVSFFQRFVSVQLDRRIVDEHVWPVFPTDESVALRIIEPLDLTFELSHSARLSSFHSVPAVRGFACRPSLRRNSDAKGPNLL